MLHEGDAITGDVIRFYKLVWDFSSSNYSNYVVKVGCKCLEHMFIFLLYLDTLLLLSHSGD